MSRPLSGHLLAYLGHRIVLGSLGAEIDVVEIDRLITRMGIVLPRHARTRVTHLRRQRPFENPDLHRIGKIRTRIEHRRGVARITQRRRNGVPAETDEVHAHSRLYCRLHTRNHVSVPGDEDHIRALAAHSVLHHIRHKPGVHGLL